MKQMTHDEVTIEWAAAEKREAIGFEDRLSKVVTQLRDQRDESIQERIRKLEKRIEHLEAVAYAMGLPPTREDVGAWGHE